MVEDKEGNPRVEISEPSANGTQADPDEGKYSSGGYASQAYPFLERELSGGMFNAAKELFHGSNLPTEYLPRTRIDEDEIGRSMRIVARHNRVTKGYSDKPAVIAWKYNARMGLGGKARMEVVRVATNQPYDPQMDRGRINGISNRARDVHPQKENN